jgi:hypothetical protein
MVVSNTIMPLAIVIFTLIVVCPARGAETTTSESSPQKEAEDTAQPFKGEAGLRVEPHPQGEPVGVLGRLYEQRLLIKAQVELMNAGNTP